MLRHYLVLRQEGVPLYSFTNKRTEPHMDSASDNPGESQMVQQSTLFSGLISGFVTMSKEMGSSLQQVRMADIDIYMYEHEELIGVALADPSQDPEEVDQYKTYTRSITEEFTSRFREELANWDGNVTPYKDFSHHIFERYQEEIEPGVTCAMCIVSCVSSDEITQKIAENC